MPTAAQVREWARETGREYPQRGPLPDKLWAEYEAATDAGLDAAAPLLDNPPDDYGGGVTAADFGTGEDVTPEQRPRAVRPPAKRPGRGWRFGGARQQGKAKGKAKPKRPRVPVDSLIGGAWRMLANVTRPIPPTHKVLVTQAPVAGMVLEDAVKGTVVDTMLQPVARLGQVGRTASALFGPPILTTATWRNPNLAPVTIPMLRELLMAQLDVTAPYMERVIAREAEFESKYGRDVDQFIAWLFEGVFPGGPGPGGAGQDGAGPPPEDISAAAEDEAIRRAQGMDAETAARMAQARHMADQEAAFRARTDGQPPPPGA